MSLPRGRFHDTADLLRFLETTRNDLEAPALALEPVIASADAVLHATRDQHQQDDQQRDVRQWEERRGHRPADDDQKRWNGMATQPNGIILVTGPTGSGKTTTLYSTLKKLATPEVNV